MGQGAANVGVAVRARGPLEAGWAAVWGTGFHADCRQPRVGRGCWREMLMSSSSSVWVGRRELCSLKSGLGTSHARGRRCRVPLRARGPGVGR